MRKINEMNGKIQGTQQLKTNVFQKLPLVGMPVASFIFVLLISLKKKKSHTNKHMQCAALWTIMIMLFGDWKNKKKIKILFISNRSNIHVQMFARCTQYIRAREREHLVSVLESRVFFGFRDWWLVVIREKNDEKKKCQTLKCSHAEE